MFYFLVALNISLNKVLPYRKAIASTVEKTLTKSIIPTLARHLLPPSETFCTSNGLHIIELLAKVGPMNTLKQLKLSPRLLVVVYKLMVQSYC